MRAPVFAGRGGTVACIAIGGELAGDDVFRRTGFVAKEDFKAVIGEGISLGILFVGLRSFDGE